MDVGNYPCHNPDAAIHYDVIKWKYFPRYWPYVRGIHRRPVNSPHKGPWRGALMFSLICVWINCWANNHEASDLRRHRGHYDLTVMYECWPKWYHVHHDLFVSSQTSLEIVGIVFVNIWFFREGCIWGQLGLPFHRRLINAAHRVAKSYIDLIQSALNNVRNQLTVWIGENTTLYHRTHNTFFADNTF